MSYLYTIILPIFVFLLHQTTTESSNSIVISTSTNARIFHNQSLGLQVSPSLQHQCASDGKKYTNHPNGRKNQMYYTPNRKPQEESIDDAINQDLQSCIVLALGAHSAQPHYDYGPAGSLNGLMSVWDSWLDNFFSEVSNTTSLVMLLDERDFKNQNITTSKSAYIDLILHNNMGLLPASCVSIDSHSTTRELRNKNAHKHQFHHANCKPSVSSELKSDTNQNHYLNLDQGYFVYYYDYASMSENTNLAQSATERKLRPLMVFVSLHAFPRPEWAKDQDEEYLFVHWRPRRLNRRYPTNYGYVKMTNWYAYHMQNLQILDYFDYGIKLDNDVSFVNSFPLPNLPLVMAQQGAKMLITTRDWYNDDPRICQGIRQCLQNYLHDENKICHMAYHKDKDLAGLATHQAAIDGSELIPGGINYTVFWENNMNVTFRSHFVAFWLGIYTSPQVKYFAQYWNDWDPRGMWDYRWGDQQYWPRPLALFGNGNLTQEILHYEDFNSDNEKYVVHKMWPRQWTVSSTNYFSYQGSNRSLRDQLYTIAAKKFIKK